MASSSKIKKKFLVKYQAKSDILFILGVYISDINIKLGMDDYTFVRVYFYPKHT